MKILIHIPHSSLELPETFYEGLLIEPLKLEIYNMEHTDLYTDRLFAFDDIDTITAGYSRLYCDVERFKDDDKEPMSKIGQGVIYTHLYDGKPFHKHDQSYQDEVMTYYDLHHQKLDDYVNQCQKNNEELCIIDAHSFSDKLANHFFEGDYPDIDLGINDDFQHPEILEMTKQVFIEHGYTVAINLPYKWSIVTNEAIKSNYKGVFSMMIEVNKRTYLNDNQNIDVIKFDKLRSVLNIIKDYIEQF
jgi:N-formylglutamate amidohydrolase